MADPVSRRSFLLASAGLVAAAACGGDSDEATTQTTGAGPTTTRRPASTMSVLMANTLIVSGVDQRIAFAVISPENEPIPTSSPVTVAFAGPDNKTGTPVAAASRSEGIEERPFFVAQHRFA